MALGCAPIRGSGGAGVRGGCALAAASRFCGAMGQRSLPLDLVLAVGPGGYSATVVFRCFEPVATGEAT